MADNDRLPPEIDLDRLFADRRVFSSSDAMTDAGF